MKKVLVFSLLISLLTSCHFLIERELVPTLIVSATGSILTIKEIGVNKDLGSTEFTAYDIGTYTANLRNGQFDTTFVVNLKVDSLVRVDYIGGVLSTKTHKR